jgi:phosphoglycerate dehydrogenase-like enzyme
MVLSICCTCCLCDPTSKPLLWCLLLPWLQGLGMKVLAYDIRPNPKVEAMGIPYMSVEEILPQADVVSVHVPLLPSTYHFIDQKQ